MSEIPQATDERGNRLGDSLHTSATPLTDFPSILALRDLRRRVRPTIDERMDRAATVRLLELDPLTVLRCMRVFYAPLHGARGHVVSIPQLVDRLGVAFIKRAFCNPSIPGSGATKGIRELWLHTFATAVAARSLAQQVGAMNPDQAFAHALLADLGSWITELRLWRGHERVAGGVQEWIAGWNLPLALGDTPPGPTRDLIERARDLACCAGFRHPRSPEGQTLAPGSQRVASMQDFVRGNRLRADVTEVLRQYGLEATALVPAPEADRQSPDDDALFPNKTVGRITDLVLTLASCQRSEHSRALVTATTSAALRYLGFDRAYTIRWIRGLSRCWIRQKADLTPRPIATSQIGLTAHEREMFESALATGDPQLIVPDDDGGEGLLSMLGCDSILAVPINTAFHVPTLLILDRAVSGGPIDLRRDRGAVKALANISSLLLENLLHKRQRARVTKFALTDPLTRLTNRGVGIATLRQEIARSGRTGDPLTVLMMDLDKFKTLNDTYGHLVGDQALRSAAEVLRKSTRKMDTVARYGGEEFMVILPSTTLEDASVTATRIQSAVEAAGIELDLPLTVSIGIAMFHAGEDNVESLLSRADRALYASKERGRNRFSVDVEGPRA